MTEPKGAANFADKAAKSRLRKFVGKLMEFNKKNSPRVSLVIFFGLTPSAIKGDLDEITEELFKLGVRLP